MMATFQSQGSAEERRSTVPLQRFLVFNNNPLWRLHDDPNPHRGTEPRRGCVFHEGCETIVTGAGEDCLPPNAALTPNLHSLTLT